MELNKKVADFTLQTDEDKTVSLSDYAGKPVILFFYPRADTPGCTIEACGFRDTFKKLQAAGAVVLGISRDTPRDQAKFRAKFDLPYTLLADVDEKVCNQFGVLKEKNMYGKNAPLSSLVPTVPCCTSIPRLRRKATRKKCLH